MVLKNLDAAEAKNARINTAVLFARLWKRNNPWLKRSAELLNTILTRVGGPGNIASCGNCMTRLRLGVHDSSLVDPNIKTLEGVKGSF